MTIITCKWCGGDFGKTHGSQLYCSPECSHAAQLERKRKADARWQALNRDWISIKNRNEYAWRKGGVGSYTWDEFNDLCIAHDWRCAACGQAKPLEADHVMPLAKGGLNVIENIQPLCKSCNAAKKDTCIDFRKIAA